jgi:N-acetylmuramoyl-L-alanine amidase
MNIITNIKSPNFEPRESGCIPRFIILHYIAEPFESAISQYCDENIKLSPHYAIQKTGEIYNLVPDEYTAWHAGASYWQGIERLNHHSLGIEMDNMGNEPFTDKLMNSCIKLCQLLMQKHNIPRENVLGHSDIAPGRKIDPGRLFDWKLLDKNGYIGIRHYS